MFTVARSGVLDSIGGAWRSIAIALCVAMAAVLLPAVLESQQSGAVGPPAGCSLTNAFDPSFSDDGTQVAYSAIDNQGTPSRQIFVSNLAGTERRQISSESGGTDPSNNRRPEFAPDDSDRIVWDGIVSGRDIFTAGATGAGRANISGGVAGALSNQSAQWSPTGTQLVWSSNSASANGEIYVANADGSGADPISDGGPQFNQDPVFNHDGSRVAWSGMTPFTLTGSVTAGTEVGGTTVTGSGTSFTTEFMAGDSIRLGTQVRVVSAIASDAELTVTAPFGPAATPTAVPADATPERLRREIYVANSDGTNRTTISSFAPALGRNTNPAFNHDGTRIVWSGFSGSTQDIYAANATDGGLRTNVSAGVLNDDDVDPQKRSHRFPSYSPDGSQIMWVGTGGEQEPDLDKVWIRNADGTGTGTDLVTTDSHDPTGGFDSPPVWAPNGTQVAFAAQIIDQVTRVSRKVVYVQNTTGPDSGLNPFNRTAISIVDDVSLCGTPPTTTTPPGQLPPSTTTSLPGGKPACPTGPTPFTDVRTNSFAAADIRCIYGLGITTGTSPTKYSPNDFVTREQMASFLARLWRTAGGSCPTAATPFDDVASNSFAVNDVKCIYGLAITTGTSPTKYSPNDFVTREQMASFLARVWRGAGGECPTDEAPFTDVSPTSFARNDIDCIYGLDITTGTSPTRYSPNDPVTREQMAAFLGRLYRSL